MIVMDYKVRNWANEKRCICGGDDFKTCQLDLIDCNQCTKTFCRNQKGYRNWVWECYLCWDWSCGDHEFRLDNNHRRICLICEGIDTYEIPASFKIPEFPHDKNMKLVNYMHKKDKEWRDKHPEEVLALQSPEY